MSKSREVLYFKCEAYMSNGRVPKKRQPRLQFNVVFPPLPMSSALHDLKQHDRNANTFDVVTWPKTFSSTQDSEHRFRTTLEYLRHKVAKEPDRDPPIPAIVEKFHILRVNDRKG